MEEKFLPLLSQLTQEQLEALIKQWEAELLAHSQSKVQNLCKCRYCHLPLAA